MEFRFKEANNVVDVTVTADGLPIPYALMETIFRPVYLTPADVQVKVWRGHKIRQCQRLWVVHYSVAIEAAGPAGTRYEVGYTTSF